MRKYGKYEKRPEGVPEKRPKVKSALLQTYFTSLLCMVLCVTMFFGTSYAWFTSEVNNAGNEIYIGTLDVDLLLDDISLKDNPDTKVFADGILWEPGYTAVRTLTVQNNGDLAFDYELTFTDGTLVTKDTSTLSQVADYFDVWACEGEKTVTAYSQITGSNEWAKIGTLADVLAGEIVFEGDMTEADAAAKVAHTYTIALHMNGEDGGAEMNALMGQKIGLNVKLVATQKAANANYDLSLLPKASTFDDLKSLITNAASGDVIAVTADIVMTELSIDKDITLYFVDNEVSGASFKLSNDAVLTLSNANSDGIDVAGTGTVELENMKVQATADNDAALALAENSNVKVVAKGRNKLVGAKNGDGIEVPGTATLELSGDTLTVVGNNGAEYAYDSNYDALYKTTDDTSYSGTAGSGVGNSGTVGTIYIHDMGSLTAKGYGVGAFGIGGNTKNITIKNTTILYVRGGMAREIPVDTSYGKEGNNGGAAIGTSCNGGIVTLDKVTVKHAEGGAKSAAIGGSNYASVKLNITNSTLTDITGGHSAAAVGGSRVHEEDATQVEIVINNSIIQAQGGYFGAGIGSGYDTDCSGSSSVSITITGDSKIAAVGGARAAGIGTGYHTANLTGTIEATVDTTGTAAGSPAFYKSEYTTAQAIGYGVVNTAKEGSNEQFCFTIGETVITDWYFGN